MIALSSAVSSQSNRYSIPTMNGVERMRGRGRGHGDAEMDGSDASRQKSSSWRETFLKLNDGCE